MTKLLYIEDNEDNVYMLKMRLELLGDFEVLSAEDGEKGCQMAVAEQPEVILMDLEMPVLDGWEAARRLKSEATTRDIPIIALSLLADPANTQELDWKNVDSVLGRTGTVSGEVHRHGFPRSDLQVTVDGVAIRSSLALGGWVAFEPAQGHSMVMGDLVLLETEINPVMTSCSMEA